MDHEGKVAHHGGIISLEGFVVCVVKNNGKFRLDGHDCASRWSWIHFSVKVNWKWKRQRSDHANFYNLTSPGRTYCNLRLGVICPRLPFQ